MEIYKERNFRGLHFSDKALKKPPFPETRSSFFQCGGRLNAGLGGGSRRGGGAFATGANIDAGAGSWLLLDGRREPLSAIGHPLEKSPGVGMWVRLRDFQQLFLERRQEPVPDWVLAEIG